jgi:flagellar hook assembly protein FlgD
VVIKIYSITGQLIRILDLGVKDPGKYVSRDRAAYWNGRNDDGDEVASGVYFYRLHAGEYVSTKKMVVLK